MQRFREKYAAKMSEGPDRRPFDIVTSQLGSNGGEFREIAKTIATVDTLEAFLRDMRARYPETGTLSSVTSPAPPPAPAQPKTQPQRPPGPQSRVLQPKPPTDGGRVAAR
jgi:hypothetical protein